MPDDYSFAEDSLTFDQAFDRWWSKLSRAAAEHGNMTYTAGAREIAKAAFKAGLLFSVAKKVDRKGSDLRGRVITAFRPMTNEELGRECVSWKDSDVIWPAIQLDDGTLVYAGKKIMLRNDGEQIETFFGPALLLGQRCAKDGIEKVLFSMTAADMVAGGEE